MGAAQAPCPARCGLGKRRNSQSAARRAVQGGAQTARGGRTGPLPQSGTRLGGQGAATVLDAAPPPPDPTTQLGQGRGSSELLHHGLDRASTAKKTASGRQTKRRKMETAGSATWSTATDGAGPVKVGASRAAAPCFTATDRAHAGMFRDGASPRQQPAPAPSSRTGQHWPRSCSTTADQEAPLQWERSRGSPDRSTSMHSAARKGRGVGKGSLARTEPHACVGRRGCRGALGGKLSRGAHGRAGAERDMPRGSSRLATSGQA